MILSAALATANTVPAFAMEAHRFEVVTGDAVRAIQDFGSQSGVQILVAADELQGKRLHSVSGVLSTEEGLKTLLEGTGLTHRYVGERTIALVRQTDKSAAAPTSRVNPVPTQSAGETRLRLADTGVPRRRAMYRAEEVAASTTAGGGAPSEGKLDEVVVSAQKKLERLQDVPVPVAVLDAGALADHHQVQLRDYYASVPGFSVAPNYVGTQNLSIRGITTGGLENPTVAVLIDDVPFGSSTNQGNSVPDFDPGDLARVEVMRGPQGSLYGANSMGGLVKFVTVDPSTERYGGHVTLGTLGVSHGSGAGFDARAGINVPVSDSFALRATAFTRRDPGFIDNPILGVKGANEGEASGTRVAALWRPATDVTLKLSALYQHYQWDALDEAVVAPGLGELDQNYIPGAGRGKRVVQAYGATLNAKLGDMELTSVTGYNVNDVDLSLDISFAFGPRALTELGSGSVLYASPGENTKKLTQEIRLASTIGERIEWLGGVFYTHENGRYPAFADAQDAAGRFIGRYYDSDSGRKFEEYAAFTNLTFKLTDRLDVQVGGRRSHNTVGNPQRTVTGPYARLLLGADPSIAPVLEVSDDVFTYLVTPRWKITPDLMLYGRFASGYRPGTPNPIRAGAPSKSEPDTTENYEIGLKGDFLDRTLSLDVSAYYIDWKDIQYQARDPVTLSPYYSNGLTAKSQGLELSVTSRPTRGLTLEGSLSFSTAELTENFPVTAPSVGREGDRLPNTPRFSGYFSFEQAFPISSSVTGFFGGAVSRVGDRVGPFTAGTGARQVFPAYTKTDIRGGVRLDAWDVNLFVNNLTDERGLLDGGLGYFYSPARIYIKPRTYGVSVTRSF